MKTYAFKVVLEPDGDRWRAFCPALVRQGGATWGYTHEEALKNIHEVVHMVVQSLKEHHEAIPEEPSSDVHAFPEPHVAVVI